MPPAVQTYIVTGDMDTLQLVNDHTFVYAMRKGVSDTVVYDTEEVKRKLNGLRPDQVIDYKALRVIRQITSLVLKGSGENRYNITPGTWYG